MHRFLENLKDFRQKGDWVLLIMCLITSGFGMICMASATNAAKFEGNLRYIIIQAVATCLGRIDRRGGKVLSLHSNR